MVLRCVRLVVLGAVGWNINSKPHQLRGTGAAAHTFLASQQTETKEKGKGRTPSSQCLEWKHCKNCECCLGHSLILCLKSIQSEKMSDCHDASGWSHHRSTMCMPPRQLDLRVPNNSPELPGVPKILFISLLNCAFCIISGRDTRKGPCKSKHMKKSKKDA